MDERKFRRPANGRPLAYMRPLPDWVIGEISFSDEQTITYSTNEPFAIVPVAAGPGLLAAVRVSMAFRTAESGADASNYTQLELRVGNATTYNTIATLDTQGNPGSLETVTQDIFAYLDPGDVIFAYWTRTGAGSNNYTNDSALVAVDVILERLP